ncbi:MAG: hypothetical protein SVR94_13720 [Pseudomonadota bacterium]|nr:hypothetical protein [Pseudomonadota bacterium]
MHEPYKGLRPYEEADQDNFFGRDVEKRILIDKILTHKLTLLFAASGVGKSSLLQAAVIPELKRPERENLDVVYFKDWVDDPRVTLKATTIELLTQNQKITPEYHFDPELSLAEFFRLCSLFSSEPLVIILDQFEEFFNRQHFYPSATFNQLIHQLAQAILDAASSTLFVISMREDFALELNVFKPALPTLLFENFYRLEKLSVRNAQQAIVKPLIPFGFAYEDGLLATLIRDLSQREKRDRFGSAAEVIDAPSVVEPPHLQIVCQQLWQAEQHSPQRLISHAVYASKGQAQGILDNYFRQHIKNFSFQEKKYASKAFNFLVNKHGTKMAYPLGDLAKQLRVDETSRRNNHCHKL